MTGWIDRLAEGLGVPPLSTAESERLLRVSREVAHRVERRITPLSTFLVGMGVAASVAQGMSRDVALDDAIDSLLGRLPPPGEGSKEAPTRGDTHPNAEPG